MKKVILLGVVIISTIYLKYSNAAEKYILTDLGTLGYDASYATSINNNGVIAGNLNSSSGTVWLWQENGRMKQALY